MDEENMIHEIVDEANGKKDSKHPAEDERKKGVYNDVDTRLKGDGFQDWPKYTDSIKQREM